MPIKCMMEQKEVVKALKKQHKTTKKITKKGNNVSTKDKISIAILVGSLLLLSLLQWFVKIDEMLSLDFLSFLPGVNLLSSKVLDGAITVIFIITISKLVKTLLINRIDDTPSRFNLTRVLNLLVGIILTFIIVSVIFANWYTAAVSLGLISLVLGFALQTPITSFIAWIFIVINRPYKVGDRIKINDAVGDVVDIGYLETTVWESYGDIFDSDHPSGRIIKFPNSNILTASVYNYTWPLFPYIWDEIKLYVAYQSDLDFVSSAMQKIAEEELGGELHERSMKYQAMVKDSPIDEESLFEKPVVSFRLNENTWVEARLHYLVAPQESGKVKTQIVKRLLKELNANQSRVMFPTGDNR